MRTVGELLMQSPTSPVKETQLQTGTNKKWAEQYHFIKNIITHTRVENGCAVADFQAAFLPPYADDALRMSAPAVSPNERQWRLQTEADCELWFHSEISNVVLAAWSQYPALTQTSHSKPMGDKAVAEEIDATYAFRSRHHKVALAIGEMKRNLINPGPWQRGNISMDMTQKRLSKELRGYADKYECLGCSALTARHLFFSSFVRTRQERSERRAALLTAGFFLGQRARRHYVMPSTCFSYKVSAVFKAPSPSRRRWAGTRPIFGNSTMVVHFGRTAT
ncbi:hypothetical protein DCS_02050 [Drechmeria coniospora]|uniref:Uncharacterized protein n=1 Tax=Drechmeria coniospora TaxID=98403 RepID=A0A151GV14_DRECN|nr:hypothetical protein DCS_02050 [Drechmeria coniospora]KYK60910.1 hypothetical protein DCS_02050 [Drechmeria coniospora]